MKLEDEIALRLGMFFLRTTMRRIDSPQDMKRICQKEAAEIVARVLESSEARDLIFVPVVAEK